jgi:DNA-binding response OmpR family regulator
MGYSDVSDSGFCPCCGHNLRPETPIVDGRFAYRPNDGFYVDGKRLPVAMQAHLLLGSIMQARGAIVHRDTLLFRVTETETDGNVVAVLACRARRACVDMGAPWPIATVRGRGLRWVGEQG